MISAKTKRWLYPVYAFIGILLFLGVFGGIKACSIMSMMKAFASMQPPPSSVSAAPAVQTAWRPAISAIGTVTAVNGVNVSNELAGKIVSIDFHSGDEVKKDQLLVQLDDSQEQALLKQYESQEKLNKSNYQRALSLRKKNLNSKQDLDNASTQYEMSQAQVAQEKAVIAKKAIRAPFAGIVGIRQVNLGQYLSDGTTIVNLEQLDPLYVTFTLPQADVSRLHLKQDVELTLDGYPGRTFTAKLSAINPAVSEQSRTMQAQATVPNPEHLLHPGMFANLRVLSDNSKQVVVIPRTAVIYTLYGDSVYVLETQKTQSPSSKTATGPGTAAMPAAGKTSPGTSRNPKTVYTARQVFVQVGDTRNGMIEVTGLKPGMLVVTAGQIKLHPGARAAIDNSVDLGKVPELTP